MDTLFIFRAECLSIFAANFFGARLCVAVRHSGPRRRDGDGWDGGVVEKWFRAGRKEEGGEWVCDLLEGLVRRWTV